MIALPPFSKVLTDELDVALRLQSLTGRTHHLPKIFDVSNEISHHFKPNYPQEALTLECRLQGNTILSRSVYLADVQLTNSQPFEESNKTARSRQLLSTYINLFNHACRNASKVNGIPFISWNERSSGFLISKGNGTFHDAFREPCSYLNLMSFVYFLKHKKQLFTQEEILILLEKLV